MTSEITIKTEKQNHGDWLKIYIPYPTKEKTTAYIQNSHGEIIKHVKLSEGNNAIDISNIEDDIVDVKVDTPYEIILRKIYIIHS
jgi:hypothetical protein